MKRRDLLVGGLFASGAALLPSAASTARDRVVKGAKATGSLVVDGLDTSDFSRKYVEMQRSAGVDCVHKSVGDLRSFADLYNFVDANSDVARVVRTVGEIRQAKADGKLAILAGWQSADALDTARGGRSDWWSTPPHTELRAFYELGLRIVGIAYQVANAFGGGGQDPQLGLSRAGRSLVEEIHHLKIVLDVGGHTGDQASLDALAMTSGIPVVCTHAATRKFANSSRNLSDAVIDGIAKTGGVIGIPAYNDFVVRGKEMVNVDRSPWGGIDDFLKHADYIKSRVGAEHVSWGPDFTYGRPDDRGYNYPFFGPEVLDKGPRRYLKGLEDVTQLVPTVRAGLKAHGWSEAEIAGFMGDNWIRVYEKVWGA
jgi:membrane dipeptidase